MKYIQGSDRKQTAIFPISMDMAIGGDNEVRIIDFFADSLDIEKMGFTIDHGDNGRPAYHPKDLIKLFLYGYMNRTRSSRELEKETKRNIEVIWLLKGLSPDHNTISNFRRDNPDGIKKVFRSTVEIAKNFELIGGKLIAGDGTKLRAQNSKKNNYNQKKIDRHIDYIDKKLQNYNESLSETDGDLTKEIKEKIAKHKEQKQKYQSLEKQLQESGEKQISTSDPDSKQLIIRGTITEVAYNVQSTVDAENKILLDYEVSNQNDKKAMTSMVEKAIEIVGNNEFDAVFDKGYHTAEQLHNCHELGIETHVAIPAPASNAPNKKYNVSEFIYNKENDTYSCPAGEILTSNGSWYVKRNYRVKQYKTKLCKTCTVKTECTRSQSKRLIERHEFAEALQRNKEALKNNPKIYKQRQAIVEHPFGTMKRAWSFDHIMTKKTKERASADVGLIFTAYNLRRLINLIGVFELGSYLRALLSILLAWFFALRPKISRCKPSYFLEIIQQEYFNTQQKGLFLLKI